jgi:CYTH domain-containing protein
MNKTAFTEYRRLFLIEKLPEPLEPKSTHVQVFDNYIEGTRMRLRLMRDPYSKNWTRILQQKLSDGARQGAVKTAEMYLNDPEYSNFEQFEGREIRKNCYFHEFVGESFTFEVYLGELWGLSTAQVRFEKAEHAEAFYLPAFAVFDITNDVFFVGSNLVGKRFDDVRDHVAGLGRNIPPPSGIFED